jgi:hypothetical protein
MQKRIYLNVEQLNDRVLPSVSVVASPASHTLTIKGDDNPDVIDVVISNNKATVSGTNFAAKSFNLSGYYQINLGGKGGDDTISVHLLDAAFAQLSGVNIWGDGGNDKVTLDVWSSRQPTFFVDGDGGGRGSDNRVAISGIAVKNLPMQNVQKVWYSDLARPKEAATVAEAFLGRSVADLMNGNNFPEMSKGIRTDVCCANFVSACLQRAGLIDASLHSNTVAGLESNLLKAGWTVTDAAHAKRGDVVIMQSGVSHTELVDSNDNGNLTLIGANNPHGGMQFVTIDRNMNSYVRAHGGVILTPPR